MSDQFNSTAQDQAVTAIKIGIGRHLLVGSLAAFALIVGLGGMAATFEFAGAVVTAGRLVVSSNIKKIQHPIGGTVTRIAVEDGDKVKAGDILVQLDATAAAASLAIIAKGLDEAVARKARLQAELAGFESIRLPEELAKRMGEPAVREAVAIEQGVFTSGSLEREGEKARLAERIVELKEQLEGVEVQAAAVKRQIELANEDLKGLRRLRDKDLVSTDRISGEEHRAAQLDGQLGQLTASAGQIGAAIAQSEIQILQIDQKLRSEASRELADTGSIITELTERKIAAEDQFRKMAVRSPIDGIIYQRAVHAVGAVVASGEAIMMVVPDNDVLVVEAQISPHEVDRVDPPQAANIRFTSLGQTKTPEFSGVVESISPDLVADQRSGQSFFIARIKLSIDNLAEVSDQLIPGMPVEVFISTGERTVLSYLVKPLGDQIMRTFREY